MGKVYRSVDDTRYENGKYEEYRASRDQIQSMLRMLITIQFGEKYGNGKPGNSITPTTPFNSIRS